MNVERVREMAHVMGGLSGAEFSMDTWYCKVDRPHEDECGTVACIAGWTCIYYDKVPEDIFHEVEPVAADILGLGPNVARALFVPSLRDGLRETLTPEDASAVLHMVADGMDPEAAWHKHLAGSVGKRLGWYD